MHHIVKKRKMRETVPKWALGGNLTIRGIVKAVVKGEAGELNDVPHR
jgi:hypothetical protein